MVCMLLCQQAGLLVCGLAASSQLFICGRVLSGLGSGGISVGALVIIDGLVRKEQRPVFTASTIGCTCQTGPLLLDDVYSLYRFEADVMPAVSQLGLLLGPIIGGAMAQNLSWRWSKAFPDYYVPRPIMWLH